MIVTVERGALLDVVSKLQRVVGTKTSMPVLEGILLSAEQGKVTLIAYNLEIGIKKEIYAKCEEEGDIVISARLLGDILRRMNGNQVNISANEKLNCTIKCGEATFDIMGMAASDYPEVPTIGLADSLTIDAKLFTQMVKGTIFATAQTEGSKPVFSGISVEIKDGTMRFVAIDGYRLAIQKHNVSISGEYSFILTGKSVGEAIKLIDETTESVQLKVGERQIGISIDGYEMIARLIEGEFVNYNKIIPEGHEQRIVLNTRELIDTVERVSLLISESFSTPVRCYFNELNVAFTCATTVGRAAETFNAKLEGESFEIGLNSRYLLDAMKAVDTEQVQFLFNGANSGVVIKPLEGDEFLYMIMPMRLR